MMRNKFKNLAYVSVIVIFIAIVSVHFINVATADEKGGNIEVEIKGMGCEMCAKAIKTLVMKCDGVEGCAISSKDGKAIIQIQKGKNREDVLREIDEKLFFPYTLMPAP
ncbi:MAG: heavy-metal-associated domain-containing protein [Candidatus Scalindua sp.]|nr:heavy-metal-associated domain-containing protein [Candidatus Scalindua sp.]